jgi:RNA:NAD 2'-phosphotransferase (TPT1/KptA family)
MAKSGSTKEIELRPDGWERFDRAVTAAAKSGPKHRATKKVHKAVVARVKKKRSG